MILEAIHTTIKSIIPAYPLVGDIEAVTPFCIYRATPQPMRDKNGVDAYTYTVEIGIVDASPNTVNTYTESIKTAILAMSGTINSTEILAVIETDESGIYFQSADQVYINDLEFKIFTKNR